VDNVDQYIWEYVRWIRLTYGRVGCVVALLIILSVLTLAYVFLSRLPESKAVIAWSKCNFCKYKNKDNNAFVMLCTQYEKPRWNQFLRPTCSTQDCQMWCINGLSNPTVFQRSDLPREVLETL